MFMSFMSRPLFSMHVDEIGSTNQVMKKKTVLFLELGLVMFHNRVITKNSCIFPKNPSCDPDVKHL